MAVRPVEAGLFHAEGHGAGFYTVAVLVSDLAVNLAAAAGGRHSDRVAVSGQGGGLLKGGHTGILIVPFVLRPSPAAVKVTLALAPLAAVTD